MIGTFNYYEQEGIHKDHCELSMKYTPKFGR